MQHCLNKAEVTVKVAESAQFLDMLIFLIFPQNSNFFPLPYTKPWHLVPSRQTPSFCRATLLSSAIWQWLFLKYSCTLKIMVGEGNDHWMKCLCGPVSCQMRLKAAKNSSAEEGTANAQFWSTIWKLGSPHQQDSNTLRTISSTRKGLFFLCSGTTCVPFASDNRLM